MNEYVVLVTKENQPIGTMEKSAAHSKDTPLHRGFSLFLFNKKGELLLQQRSSKKKTWPGTWSNSVCGHPMLNEDPVDAAKRRLAFELGLKNVSVSMILPDYRYRFEKDNIVENEICPVMVCYSDEEPVPNPEEVETIKWIPWKIWLYEIQTNSDYYSPWCIEETILLTKSRLFSSFLNSQLSILNS